MFYTPFILSSQDSSGYESFFPIPLGFSCTLSPKFRVSSSLKYKPCCRSKSCNPNAQALFVYVPNITFCSLILFCCRCTPHLLARTAGGLDINDKLTGFYFLFEVDCFWQFSFNFKMGPSHVGLSFEYTLLSNYLLNY